MDNFIYILQDSNTKDIAIVDPAWDYELILSEINRLNGTLKMVLLTHCHFDHVNALEQLLEHYDIPVYVSQFSQSLVINELSQSVLVKDGDTIDLGTQAIQVLTTPGHSACGVCYVSDSFIVTGDTLFLKGCGRADLQGSDPIKLYHSLNKLKKLPDDLMVYCGHHYGDMPVDSLGNQKKTNPYLTCLDQDSFLRKRMGR